MREFQPFVRRKPPNSTQQGCKILAVDVLHREKSQVLELSDVVNAANIRMRYLTRVADFSMEHLKPVRIFREGARQEFESDRMAELEVIRSINLAHTSAPKRRNN